MFRLFQVKALTVELLELHFDFRANALGQRLGRTTEFIFTGVEQKNAFDSKLFASFSSRIVQLS